MGAHILPSEGHNAVYIAGATLALLYTLSRYINSRKLNVEVPSIGPSASLLSYCGTIKYISKGQDLLRDAVQKHKGGTFKVPELDKWNIVVNKPELIDEIQKATEDKLSFNGALDDVLLTRYTIGESVVTIPYHVPTILHQLTRNISRLFDGLKDEIEPSFIEHFPCSTEEWAELPVFAPITEIVARLTTRDVTNDLPSLMNYHTGRDSDYLKVNDQLAGAVGIKSQVIHYLPEFLRPIANVLMRSPQRLTRKAMKFLAPSIEYRLSQFTEFGVDWSEKPCDLLQWLLEDAPEEERTVEKLTQRILLMNFVATHTSANTLIMAIYDLASRQEYIQPIREEIEGVVAEEGWSKASLMKMRKLESFMKESQRFSSLELLTMGRKVMSNYTLSDGTFLPTGSTVSVNADNMHFNDERYANASKFEGFRFLKEETSTTNNGDAAPRASHLMVATSADFLAFGLGRHACPGRFFAVTVMKMIMAHLLLNYDIKTKENGVRPKNLCLGSVSIPNTKAKLLFRKRVSKE